jgi:hypothetical protein
MLQKFRNLGCKMGYILKMFFLFIHHFMFLYFHTYRTPKILVSEELGERFLQNVKETEMKEK